jgi:putative endonuclease
MIGAIGEEIAVDLLKQKGLVILARNFRCKFGEIDIIARDQRTLVFVEVKTRTSLRWGRPEEAVNHKKQARLRLLAAFYLQKNLSFLTTCRFDVCSVYLNEQNGLQSAEILRNCF